MGDVIIKNTIFMKNYAKVYIFCNKKIEKQLKMRYNKD